ncbi:P-II family nitrogen regulator [Methanosarcina siciliae]|uniref:P-II family nitrogen regulator n=1 Tax=Methanosarcina siciliae TaxID=38027 RepID=UPI001E54F7E3|nr:P-II family nitrogen regulator [Methanosarcina siciliae]
MTTRTRYVLEFQGFERGAALKEIIAIIRPKKVEPTKEALVELGIPSVTVVPVFGRGKQRGIAEELNIDIRPGLLDQGLLAGMKYMEFIPKRLLYLIVSDEDVDTAVDTIIKVNQTAQIGDGRVFICPVDNAIRVRTDDQGDSALL